VRVTTPPDADHGTVDQEVRLLAMPDGRTLEVHLTNWAGTAADAPVVVDHHGTPGCGRPSSITAAAAARHGVRLVGPTRPGYAGSTPQPGRDVAAVAADVAAVLDQLGVGRAAVMGGSGGGPHALATAAGLPGRIAAAATLASVGPYGAAGLDFLAGMGQDNLDEFGAALAGEPQLRAYLEAQRPGLVGVDAEQIAPALHTLLPPVDRAAVTGVLAADVAESFTSALAPGIEGWLDDDLAFARPWGFALADLAVPVSIWQGGADLMVPAAHGAWLADRIPGATAHLLPLEGHVSIVVGRIDEILAALVSAL